MAPRPNWKGFLKLSLVSCGVAMYPATSTSQRIRFNIINKATGNRIRNEVVDAETGEPVESEDRVKGYKVEKGEYVLLEDDELDNVALESTHTIDIDEFIPMADVDRIYLDESYYIVPQDEVAQEAFAVIREAMRKEDLAGLARVVVYRRERLLLLRPRGKGTAGHDIALQERSARRRSLFRRHSRRPRCRRICSSWRRISSSTKKGKFDPAKFEDRYETALKELVKAKQAGRKAPGTIGRPAEQRRQSDGRAARAAPKRMARPIAENRRLRSANRRRASGPRRAARCVKRARLPHG